MAVGLLAALALGASIVCCGRSARSVDDSASEPEASCSVCLLGPTPAGIPSGLCLCTLGIDRLEALGRLLEAPPKPIWVPVIERQLRISMTSRAEQEAGQALGVIRRWPTRYPGARAALRDALCNEALADVLRAEAAALLIDRGEADADVVHEIRAMLETAGPEAASRVAAHLPSLGESGRPCADAMARLVGESGAGSGEGR